MFDSNLKDNNNDFNITKNNHNFLEYLLRVFACIDVIATLIIGMSSILLPNLQTTFFKKEPIIVFLFIGILFLIILSLSPVVKNKIFTIIRLIIGSIITLFLSYCTLLFIIWYFKNIEGSFDFRIFSFTKKASFDDKISLYHTMTSQMLNAIQQENPAMAEYLSKSPSLYNPPTIKIMQTSYNLIPDLVQKTILMEKANYDLYMQNMINVAKTSNYSSSSSSTYFKWTCVILGGVIVIYGIYYMGGFTSLADITKKGFNSLVGTQNEIIKTSVQLKKDAILDTQVETTFKYLIEKLSTLSHQISLLQNTNGNLTEKINILSTQIVSLTNKNSIHEELITRCIDLINKVIRPCIQSTFSGLNSIDSDTGTLILKSLTPEQHDFILTISKLIFT